MLERRIQDIAALPIDDAVTSITGIDHGELVTAEFLRAPELRWDNPFAAAIDIAPAVGHRRRRDSGFVEGGRGHASEPEAIDRLEGCCPNLLAPGIDQPPFPAASESGDSLIVEWSQRIVCFRVDRLSLAVD